MADVRCCHCGDPIQPTREAHPSWPSGVHPWLHVKTDAPECRTLYAAPRIDYVITAGPPRERIVYVPVYRDGRGGVRRG